jgi:hypothetical protein
VAPLTLSGVQLMKLCVTSRFLKGADAGDFIAVRSIAGAQTQLQTFQCFRQYDVAHIARALAL